MFIFSLQPGGFTIEISNNNSTMVMTGMRIQIGTQAIERAPSYIEIFGRTMQLNLSRSRWFDFPFTREEALQADKKLNLFSESPMLGADFYPVIMSARLEATSLWPISILSSPSFTDFFVVSAIRNLHLRCQKGRCQEKSILENRRDKDRVG